MVDCVVLQSCCVNCWINNKKNNEGRVNKNYRTSTGLRSLSWRSFITFGVLIPIIIAAQLPSFSVLLETCLSMRSVVVYSLVSFFLSYNFLHRSKNDLMKSHYTDYITGFQWHFLNTSEAFK